MRCTAKAKSTGKLCGRSAIAGSNVCRVHGGAAPQTVQAAKLRLLGAIDPAMAELIRIALRGQAEAVRVSAIKELFERAGFGDPKRVEVTQMPDRQIVADWVAALERDLASDN